jgi:hypothetical protein
VAKGCFKESAPTKGFIVALGSTVRAQQTNEKNIRVVLVGGWRLAGKHSDKAVADEEATR